MPARPQYTAELTRPGRRIELAVNLPAELGGRAVYHLTGNIDRAIAAAGYTRLTEWQTVRLNGVSTRAALVSPIDPEHPDIPRRPRLRRR